LSEQITDSYQPIKVSLDGKGVRLRAIREEDLPFLWHWRNDVRDLMMWSGARSLTTEHDYAEEIRNDNTRGVQRLAVEEIRSGELVGHVFAYGYDPQNGHTFVGVFLCREKRRLGYGVEALALFLQYAFAYFPLVKVYMDVYEFNTQSLHLSRNVGLHQEGEYQKHISYGGRRWTLFRFAMYREDLPQLSRLLARVQRGCIQEGPERGKLGT
jgi:RimJ/RimL family protein N-acetyltransferase